MYLKKYAVAFPFTLSSGITGMPGKHWWKNPFNLHSSGPWVSSMISKQLLLWKKKIPKK